MKTNILIALSALALITAITTTSLSADQQTWLGQISDSRCGAVHEEDADVAGGGRQDKLTDRECTLACIRGGSKYVLVVDGKLLQIADQKDPALEAHAGDLVKLTGEMNGNVITVSKIETP